VLFGEVHAQEPAATPDQIRFFETKIRPVLVEHCYECHAAGAKIVQGGLRQLVFGVVGLGRIGTATALRAKALGFQTLFYDPYLANGVDKAVGIPRTRSLDELLGKADVLSVHCPLNDETHHMIAEDELALMKPSASVVNTARGAVIKKTAILNALRTGQLAGAGLDVVEDEPLKTLDEAATPNLIVTCHAAFCSVESKNEMRATSARIALAAVRGLPLENIVNEVEVRI
jgi:phosphoglycerate dehydrogenase-like enzyme